MKINWSQMTDEWIRQRFGDEMELDQIVNCRNELVNTGLIKDMELFIEKKTDEKCWLRRLPIFIKKGSNLNAQIRLNPKYQDKSITAGASFSKGQPSLNVNWSKIFYNKYNPFALDASVKMNSIKGLPQLSVKASLPWFEKDKHRDTYHASVATNCKENLWNGETVLFASKVSVGSDRLGAIRVLE
ncbi:hypothetical protein GNI_010860 [Gregarina niphandrodes]|uniref:Uncharacterized protein n=1 Tax=Gregarina niphandrodes TaxID=110365 RepID=A0A023BCV7_GRENI|nr:hypothetical protein GNI_010860 [Gregarina niphandrodes]EZG86180.1 hypothetical protein GNI_010860 [Gregarina niphandrodes]|eukprot:XP_011128783.1 hypothetical protein GNI_010860 [Gregarina niphandrodes]